MPFQSEADTPRVLGRDVTRVTDGSEPHVLVFSSLFPRPGQPGAGLFIRERMFRVARELPLVVISPQPWFPFQGLIRRFRPGYRPPSPYHLVQQGIDVYCPRFFSVPGIGRRMDGLMMALFSLATVRRLQRRFGVDIIDAHFAYPDGYAATRLGRWLELPVSITLRGTEVPLSRSNRRSLMLRALEDAAQIFSVADSLKRFVVGMGIDEDKVLVVGNGVDVEKFHPEDREGSRRKLGLPLDARVLVTVGGLVERKGFHRVIDCLPGLMAELGEVHYLVVGGASGEGDWSDRLRQQVKELELDGQVHFLGSVAPDHLRHVLSAADLFVLSTRNEGWANVLLEAMACGLPIVATDVGGNSEVVCREELGTIVPFGDESALCQAIADGLKKTWCTDDIIGHARANTWDSRVTVLVKAFKEIACATYGKP